MIDIINRPYAEAIANANLEGDNIVDVAKPIENKLAKYKVIQISLSLKELARLSPKFLHLFFNFFLEPSLAFPFWLPPQ